MNAQPLLSLGSAELVQFVPAGVGGVQCRLQLGLLLLGGSNLGRITLVESGIGHAGLYRIQIALQLFNGGGKLFQLPLILVGQLLCLGRFLLGRCRRLEAFDGLSFTGSGRWRIQS